MQIQRSRSLPLHRGSYEQLTGSPSVRPSEPAPRRETPTVTPAAERFQSRLTPSQYRTALALHEAMLPGSRTVPAADEATLASVEEVVFEFAPQLHKAWVVAQQSLSAASFARTGRPFAALDAATQERLIQSWTMDPVLRAPLALLGFFAKLVHFDREPIYRSLGGVPFKKVERLEQPRWLEQIHRADAWEDGDDVECDVVVVGTGAGGAVVGRELAARGYAVVFVEEGEHHRRDAFTGSAVHAHRMFYRNAFTVGNVVMPALMGRMVGGSTAINTGSSLRTPPWVLDAWCESIGTDEFAPSRMEAHFERVETFLGIRRPERRFIGPIADVFDRGGARLGWHCDAVPRNAEGCEGGGFCDYGCATDARRSTNLSYLPAAFERGAICFTGLKAERVLIEQRGVPRAVGIEGVTQRGRRIRVHGKAVVFAGGAIPTPLFLLRQGICNESGQVGRGLSLHPSTGVTALFEERINGHRHIPQPYLCDQFLRDGILINAAQADANNLALTLPCFGRRLMDRIDEMPHLAGLAVLVRDDEQHGRVWRDVSGNVLLRYDLSKTDLQRLHLGMQRAAELAFAAGAKRVFMALQGSPEYGSMDDLARFRKQRLRAADIACVSYHPLGTCRMGKDPRSSVVGTDHQTHDVRGLYLVDGSTVPGAPGVNPQLTIMAMATRAAERIADALG